MLTGYVYNFHKAYHLKGCHIYLRGNCLDFMWFVLLNRKEITAAVNCPHFISPIRVEIAVLSVVFALYFETLWNKVSYMYMMDWYGKFHQKPDDPYSVYMSLPAHQYCMYMYVESNILRTYKYMYRSQFCTSKTTKLSCDPKILVVVLFKTCKLTEIGC
jgi:hypothetical protein